MALSDEFLSEIRMRADVENIISSYVTLKRKGKILSGLCPFHNEKTPSFTVYPETQSYYCFGCGAGGDVITFIRDIENLDYIEAAKFLADRVGLALPQDNFDNGLSKKRTLIYEANREAARFFNAQLYEKNGRNAIEYFYNRKLSDSTIRKFGLGYAPDTWDSLLKHMKDKGFSEQLLYEANLIRLSVKNEKKHYYDSFKNRVMFPIVDLRGNVVAFGGRVLDDTKPKYLNTNDTLVYKKGNELFALNIAKKTKAESIILCEGYMDVIALHQAGFNNAVAGLGTALTEEQAHLLSRYTSEVIICYDSDEAGQKAAKKAISIFSKTTLRIKVIQMQGGKDPDDIIKKFGAERFKNLIDGASNDIEYKLLREREKFDVNVSDGKLNFLKAAAIVLSELKSPLEIEIYANKLSSELGVNKDAILAQVKDVKRINYKKQSKVVMRDIEKYVTNPNDRTNKINPERAKNLRAAKAEETIIATIMKNPEFLKVITDKLSKDDFITNFNKRVFSSVADRISELKPVELSFLASDFTSDEISEIARIQTLTENISNTVTECNDCIKVLLEEKGKINASNPANLSNEDFLKIFKQN
ncbi:MAG: DNA primase [Oscillospiraceae bacterium]